MRNAAAIGLALLISAAAVWSGRHPVVPPSGGMSALSTETLPLVAPRPDVLPALPAATAAAGAGVDPAILRRALSPPSRSLPPEARPRVMVNSPPSEVWQDLQHQQHAVAQ